MSRYNVRLLRFAIISALVIWAPGPLLAQTQTGTITGTVTDEQNAVLPGVTVTLEAMLDVFNVLNQNAKTTINTNA